MIPNRYNKLFDYDLAGNLTKTHRNGLISINAGQGTYGQIDKLKYNYQNASCRLCMG